MTAPTKLKTERPAEPRAILFTDVVGSTRYFAERGDEAGLRMLECHNRALFPVVEEANGQVIKTIGDSILAVFAQPADALGAAWSLQRTMDDLRSKLPAEEAIHIRVGVHYGLVTEKHNDVFGDAVNLADRVKSHAEGDQVMVSRTLRDMVRANPHFAFKSVGLRELKGAREPVEIFLLTTAAARRKTALWLVWARRARRLSHRHRLAVTGVFVVLLVAGGASWLSRGSTKFPERDIAVLPFRNETNDKDVDYLSVALPNELDAQLSMANAKLSRGTSLFVRPFRSVEHYRGQNLDLQRVAREQQVGTVVEGSFWRSGDQLRIKVDIVDARRDRELWSEPFESALANVMNMVDRMAGRVVGAVTSLVMNGNVSASASSTSQTQGDRQQGLHVGTNHPEAYDAYLRGLAFQLQGTEESNGKAIDFLQRAVNQDPGFGRAQALLAQAYTTRFWDFSNDTDWLSRAEKSARRALELDPQLADAHFALARALERKGRSFSGESIREGLASVVADPHYGPALTYVARYFFYMGDSDRALGMLDHLSEIDPTQHVHFRRAIYHYFAGRLPKARVENVKAEKEAGSVVEELTLIGITHVWLGDLNAAERVVQRLQQIPKTEVNQAEIRAWLYNARGQISDSRREMQVLTPRGEVGWGIAQYLAALSALQGDREQALNWMEKAIKLGAPNYAWFSSTDFGMLSGDRRYEAALKVLADEYAPVRLEFERVYTELEK
jgi:adenylate cyclase